MSSNILSFILVNIMASVACKYYTPVIETSNVTATELHDFRNITMHPACSRDYCFEIPEDYPKSLIAALVEKEKDLVIDAIGSGNRGVTDHSVLELCKVKRTIQPIYQIRDVNKVVRFVAQSEKFQQIIRIEECSNPGEIVETNAAIDLEMLRNDSYKAVCAESYYNYKFLVLSLDGTRLEIVRIGNRGVPICCRSEIQETE